MTHTPSPYNADYIATKVHTGEYFQDAKSWYCTQYLDALCQRTYITVLAIVALFSVIALLISLYFLYPLYYAIPVIIENSGYDNEHPILTPLGGYDGGEKNYANPQNDVARYLIERYIRKRESFTIQNNSIVDIKPTMNYMKNASASYVYSQYVDSIEGNAPSSVLSSIQKYASRRASITSFQWSTTDSGDPAAIVHFTSTLRKKNGTEETKDWVCTIQYSISDIQLVLNSRFPFDFVVLAYRVHPLSNEVDTVGTSSDLKGKEKPSQNITQKNTNNQPTP